MLLTAKLDGSENDIQVLLRCTSLVVVRANMLTTWRSNFGATTRAIWVVDFKNGMNCAPPPVHNRVTDKSKIII